MMRYVLTLVVGLSVASLCLAAPATQKKKKSDAAVAVEAQMPQTAADSVSYAAGAAASVGLQEYLEKEFGVDSTTMWAFVEGFKEALTLQESPEMFARSVGAQIAVLMSKRILPMNVAQFEGTAHPVDTAMFHAGFVAAISGDTTVMTMEAATDIVKATIEADKEVKSLGYKADNVAWLAENAKKEGVVTLPSGLQYKVIEQGDGAIPTKDDLVTVRYEGHLTDGTVFDSSYKRTPDTSDFRPTQVIKGWTEALTMMPVGSTWELYIPQELAYGNRQAGQIKPYSTLIFTVELVKIAE